MALDGSVSLWLGRLHRGDAAAAQPLWERYFQRLVGLARHKLRAGPRRAVDEEDVALSAFDSFCRGAGQGRFPQLTDRDSLWHLLVTLTARKAGKVRRAERQQKRGGGAVRGESALLDLARAAEGGGGLDQVVGLEPTPEFAAEVADECRRLLDRLADPELRSIALWKMEGATDGEIAARLGYVLRTVQRRVQLIRRLWEKEGTT
jgi:DNA-directed RNA polymerase specialized sigma24 family protein